MRQEPNVSHVGPLSLFAVTMAVCAVAANSASPGVGAAEPRQEEGSSALYFPLVLLGGTGVAPDPLATRTATVAVTDTPTAPGPTSTPSPSPTGVPGCDVRTPAVDHRPPEREIHVSPDGSDSSGDGSSGMPYASIGRAATDAGPGAHVVVHAGVYPGGIYLEGLRGLSIAPITIGGAPGEERPVILGATEGLHLTRVSWLELHDLVIDGASGNGVNTDDGGDVSDPSATHHVRFSGLEIRNIGSGGNQDCLKLSGINSFEVVDSWFTRCGGGGSGIDMVGAHDGYIGANGFSEMGSNAVQAKGGSTDIVIHANRFTNAGQRAINMGGSTGLEFFRPPLDPASPNAEARRIHVTANLFEGGDTPFAFVGCVECVVAHNTIVDPGVWLFRILQETTSQGGFEFEPARDGFLANNIFYFERGQIRSDVNIGPNTMPETFALSNDLWFAHDRPTASAPDLPSRRREP